MAHRDHVTRAVTLILDADAADAAMHAIAADVMEREARIRRVRQQSQDLSPGSYGRQNREAIVARETRITASLRAVEQAYHNAVDPLPAPEFGQVLRSDDKTSDHEIEPG